MVTDHGPTVVGMHASDSSLSSYSSGVYSGCTSNSVNHAVLLVGFTADGHWIIKNSWGEDWGEGGYVTIDKNNDCGITTYVDVVDIKSGFNTNYGSETTNNSTSGNSTSNSSSSSNSSTSGNSSTNGSSSSDIPSDKTDPAPAPTPTPTTLVNFTVTMTDSWGDGWNGNVIGIKANGAIIQNFGSKFLDGSTFGPVKIQVPSKTDLEVVVVVYSSWVE